MTQRMVAFESEHASFQVVESLGSRLKSRVSVELIVGEGTSVTQSIFNLVKNIVGSGVLGLSAGLAAGTGKAPALILSVLLGGFSAYTFSLVGRVCSDTGEKTFKGLGGKTGGDYLANTMAITCIMKTFMTCLSYSIVIADSFSAILRGMDVAEFFYTRTTVLLAMMCFIIAPLCLLKDLSRLAFASFAGIIGMLYTAIFVAVRCFDGSYAPGGKYYDEILPEYKPKFRDDSSIWDVSIKTLVLLCGLSTAFIAHYNAPKFYCELRERDMFHFNIVVFASFSIALFLFVSVMMTGYSTFGLNAQGNILINYSPNDPMATLARICVGFSTICTYPLAFTGLRGGILSMIGPSNSHAVFLSITGCLLFTITALAWYITNLGFVNNFGGAVFGASIIYMFPSTLFVAAVIKGYSHSTGLELLLSKCLIGIGAILVLLGGVVAVLEEYNSDALR